MPSYGQRLAITIKKRGAATYCLPRPFGFSHALTIGKDNSEPHLKEFILILTDANTNHQCGAIAIISNGLELCENSWTKMIQ